MKHRELPWTVEHLKPGDHHRRVHHEVSVMAGGWYLAFLHSAYWEGHESAIANAEFIVRACNSHYALLEALTQLIDRLDYHGSIDLIREEGPIDDARQAIAQAEEA